MRIESSIMTSLDELRSIQQQRIVDERTAFERAKVAEIEAKRAAEQAELDAQLMKARDEREAQLRIERARVDAEREARMRIEAAEAAERARQQAALEQQRLAQEIELRRAAVAKQRPTWMVAVTGLALCGGLALAWFAVARGRDADVAAQAQAAAQHDKDQAVAEARASHDELDRIQRDLDTLDAKVKAAAQRVDDESVDADRKRARHDLEVANHERAEQQRRLDEAKAKHDAWIRQQGLKLDKKCLETALGCIDHK